MTSSDGDAYERNVFYEIGEICEENKIVFPKSITDDRVQKVETKTSQMDRKHKSDDDPSSPTAESGKAPPATALNSNDAETQILNIRKTLRNIKTLLKMNEHVVGDASLSANSA